MSGCRLAAKTDYLLTLPRFVAEEAALGFELEIKELPFDMPGFSTAMHWHRRLDNDPEHRALRELIFDLVAGSFVR